MSKKQLLFGSASGVIHLGFISLLTLICIPIFIKKLGSDAYGVFAVVSIIGNLNVFTNLGINTSLIKFLAEQGKKRESDYDIIISICLLILIIVPVTILLFLLKDILILKVFKVPVEFYDQTSILFTFLLFSNIVLLIGQIISGDPLSPSKNLSEKFFKYDLQWLILAIYHTDTDNGLWIR